VTLPAQPQRPVEQRPVEQRPVEPMPPVSYTGPPSGSLVWMGQLEAGGRLTIDRKSASTGSASSELPGVPVKIQLWPSSARVIELPGPQNRWKRLVIGSPDRQQGRIIIRWEIVP
jgi:hypothetical protein